MAEESVCKFDDTSIEIKPMIWQKKKIEGLMKNKQNLRNLWDKYLTV